MKKFLSLLLAIIMVMGIFPTMAFASTVIPEDANFIGMVNDKGEDVTITKMEDHYKVEVPLDTKYVEIVYPEGIVKDNGFGYAMTHLIGFEGVSDDGDGMDTFNGKTTVSLAMEKWPANGAPFEIKLLNVPYGENPKMIGIYKNDGTILDYFAFTYKLEEGQYFAELVEGTGYTISGSPVASNGYTFSVSIDEGYEANEYFAVKVNGDTVLTEPGEYTVEIVSEDLKITVEGVQKIIKDTDIAITVDLTGYSGAIDGSICYTTSDWENDEVILEAGKISTLALEASKKMDFYAFIGSISSLVIGYTVNGVEYALPQEYECYEVAPGVNMDLDCYGYLYLSISGATPTVVNIKPIVATAESVGEAPAFAEDCIKVTDISVLGADVISAEWEGDTLNVALAEGTAPDAIIRTIWTIYLNNTKEGANQPMFNINGMLQCPQDPETIYEWADGLTLENGAATRTVAIEKADTPWSPENALDFTDKTFTVNFTIHSHSYEEVVTEPTCTEGGYTTYTCSCGDSYVGNETETVGHSYGDWVTVEAPTETEGGRAVKTCSVCGHQVSKYIKSLSEDGITVVVPGEKTESESNPNTGAPVSCGSAICAMAVLAGIVIASKNK